jgi:hypothetical protein
MLNNFTLQAIAVLALGGLLGYGAASGKLDVFRQANAESAERHLSIPSLVPKTELGNEKAAADSCCSEGATKGRPRGDSWFGPTRKRMMRPRIQA